LRRAGHVHSDRLQVVFPIVEKNGADVIVIHAFQMDEVGPIRVAVHLRRTVRVHDATTEADAVSVQAIRHLTRRDVLPGGHNAIADLVGQESDRLFDGHGLLIDWNTRCPRAENGGGVRVRCREDDVLNVD
jgi:hypothetical protein